MVAQKMGSQRGGNYSIGGTQVQTQDPKSNLSARRGSLCSLTFAEMEKQLGDVGKPLGCMNLEELLKTLFQAESNNNNNNKLVEGLDSGLSAQQPGQTASLSLLNRDPKIALSWDLSKKTIDEVWHDIQQDHKSGCLDRKVTLGEITLEDFLVKAGLVGAKINPSSVIGGVDPIGLSQQAQWMNYHPQPCMIPIFMPGHTLQQPIPIGGNPVMENQMTMSSSPLMGTLSDTKASGRKQAGPADIVENSVERRQKRMIKNRESAARSRARKQAYTHELESKVSHLEEENERLKRQQEWEKVLLTVPPTEPKYQLRRTSSSPI